MRIPAKELSDARALCTATELRLIESSHGALLDKTDQARLKKKIVLARELRDKWRDLFERQRREVQQKEGTRVNDKNRRSDEKAALFANALARFEERLAKLEAAPAAPKKSAARTAPIKAQRVQAHRVTRARTKEQLNELQLAKNSHAMLPPAVPVASAPVAAIPATAPVETSVPSKPAKSPTKRVVKKTAVKKKVALKSKRPTSAFSSPVNAKAAAKKNRIKISGKDSRVRAHNSAAGKRSQARRDSK